MSKAKELQNRIDQCRKEIARARTGGASADNTHIILQNLAEIAILLSERADVISKRIIRVTWFLAFLTAALLVFAAVQTRIMLKQDSDTHTQPVQTGQTNQPESTNKQPTVTNR